MEVWREQANCRSVPLETMYPDLEDTQAVEAAKAICAACLVGSFCLEAAMKRKEPDGIWAGTTVIERNNIRRTQRRRRNGSRTR